MNPGDEEVLTTGADAPTRPRVLVVDDEPDIREILAFELEDAGFEVVAVESGEEAIRVAGTTRFDVAVTDLRMPGIDGLMTMDRLKALQPGLPVIIATGCAPSQVEASCKDRGAAGCLWKPFDMTEFIATLWRGLKPSK